MAILIVGGVPVRVSATTPPARATRETGDYSPTIDGGEMGVIVARKYIWTIPTAPMTAADAVTLEAAIIDTPPVACSGDVLGGSVNCRGAVTGYEYMSVHGGLRIAMTFTLTEQ